MKNFDNNAFPQKKKKKCLQNRLTLFEILTTSTQKLKLKSLVLTIWVIYKNYKSIKKKVTYLYDGITHQKFLGNKLKFRDWILRQSKYNGASTIETNLAPHLHKIRFRDDKLSFKESN